MDLLIQGDPESLKWIEDCVAEEIGKPAMLEPKYDLTSGTFNEAILVGLVVALGGPVVTRAVRDIVRRRYEHIERMTDLTQKHQIALALIDGETERPIGLEDI